MPRIILMICQPCYTTYYDGLPGRWYPLVTMEERKPTPSLKYYHIPHSLYL